MKHYTSLLHETEQHSLPAHIITQQNHMTSLNDFDFVAGNLVAWSHTTALCVTTLNLIMHVHTLITMNNLSVYIN